MTTRLRPPQRRGRRREAVLCGSILLATVAALALATTHTALATTPGIDRSPQEGADVGGADAASLDAELPVGPEVTVGRLANGLTYYIRENGRPADRAELKLVVDAGSVLEDDDQRGVAHLVEHMAFNGTEHFEKQELIDFMESIGMRLGPDLNATTGFDETIYSLQVPTDVPEHVRTAFQILEDWARRVTFDEEELDKERGVVVEEWRLRRGAFQRVRDRQLPILFQGSRYAERLPIGSPESIETVPVEAVRRFYDDWYRPDLMAVIAVGDFDADEIEKLIRGHFGGLPAPDDPRPRRDFPVPDHDGTRFAIASDDELPNARIGIAHKLDVEDVGTLGAYRQLIVERLYHDMLNQRLEELTRRADPPFAFATSGKGRMVRTEAAYNLLAGVEPDGVARGLEALLTEAERVDRHGFTDTELERAKARLLRRMERAYDDRSNQESGSYAFEYVRAFLTDEPIPGIEYEYEVHRRFVPEITLEEVDRVGREWLDDDNRVVTVSVPAGKGTEEPDEAELRAVIDGVEGARIAAYEDRVTDRPLLAEMPDPSPVVESTTIEAVGVTEWRLANGVRVVLKPTDFKDDQILLRAVSHGGTSLASDEDWIYAITASRIVDTGGLGDFDATELQKALAGKAASVRPFIGRFLEGLAGEASPKDLETLFQLVYLRFTAPRADPEAFQAFRQNTAAMLANQASFPQFAFFRTLNRILTGDHPRARMMSPEIVEEFDLQESFAFYRDRFADASDFTFILVGSFDPATVRPLVERYLGGLPSLGRQESWRDVGIRPPDGVITEEVRAGREPQAMTQIVFTGPFVYDREHRLAIRVMANVLATRLRELLREELSGTYGVQVMPGYDWRPEPDYQVAIMFGCAPERVEELAGRVFDEIDRLVRNGPTEDEVADVREQMQRSYETDVEDNGWWVQQLAYRYDLGDDPSGLSLPPADIDVWTPETVRRTAEETFDGDRYVRVTLLPEAEQAEEKEETGELRR